MPRGRPPKHSNTLSIIDELDDLLLIWNRAAESPTGISIASQYPNRLAQKLYWARRECGHDGYHHLKVIELDEEVRIQPR